MRGVRMRSVLQRMRGEPLLRALAWLTPLPRLLSVRCGAAACASENGCCAQPAFPAASTLRCARCRERRIERRGEGPQ